MSLNCDNAWTSQVGLHKNNIRTCAFDVILTLSPSASEAEGEESFGFK